MDRLRSSARRLLVLLVAVTLLAGCPSTSDPAPSPGAARSSNRVVPVWSAVPLPGSSAPVTLTADGERLLVGASVASGRVRPRLFSLDADGSATAVPLTPRSPYAFLARWTSISVDRGTVWAVGGAAGGAHANTRWSVWKGTTQGVAEVPQPFSTFGGYGAGNLIGSVVTTAGPALVGSWEGARTGLDAAVWLPRGDRWLRQSSAGTPLESTPGLLVGPRSATAAGPRIVLPGSAVRLSPGAGGQNAVSQSAALWRSTRLDSGWDRTHLPEAGRSSEAVSAGCVRDECLVAGYVDGTYAVWSVPHTAAPRRLTGLPEVPVNANAPLPAPLRVGDRVVTLASSAGHVVLLTSADGSWTATDGPAGLVTSSAVVGPWLYVLADPADGPAVLWRTELDRLR